MERVEAVMKEWTQDDKQQDDRKQQSDRRKQNEDDSREKAMWTRTTDSIMITTLFKQCRRKATATNCLNSSRRFEFMHV